MLAQDRDLASLKVRVAFQAGQIEMTAGELQELAPGALILIDRGLDDVFDIVANGKRIGSGELVKVGDKLAVRVTKLSSDA
ncbi:MAG: FliM/FliN family flagellar motor switch protein [Rhodomicrobiaceae bacterium]